MINDNVIFVIFGFGFLIYWLYFIEYRINSLFFRIGV